MPGHGICCPPPNEMNDEEPVMQVGTAPQSKNNYAALTLLNSQNGPVNATS